MLRHACLLAAVSVAAAAAPPAWGQSQTTCVDVRVGTDSSYACLNEALARAAAQAHQAVPTDTLSAASAPHAVGLFDRTATAQRMGNTFGHSAFAQRPPPLVFRSPLMLGRQP